jgi:hypothetical protein
VSYLLLGGILCVLALLVAAAVVFAFVVRAERRHDEATRGRLRLGDGAEGAKGSTGDVSIFLRFEGEGAAAMTALVARFAPHGIVPPEAVGEVARAVLAVLDDATHGELVVAAYRVQPVQSPEAGGVIVCLRAQSRAPLAVIERSAHRKHLRALLRAIAALDAAQIVSGDLLAAEITTDRAAPSLRVLLGPHGTPPPLP